MIAFMGVRGAYFSGSTSEAALTEGGARNPVDHNRDRIRQGLRYRAQSNRLEVGRFIAHLIRASRADAVPCLITPRMDNGQRNDNWDIVGLAMAFEAKHEAFMTSHTLTSHPRTIHTMTNRPLRAIVLGTFLGLAGIASTAGTASARTIYDGAWSVLIVTMSGSCDPTYRYGVQIADGMVTYDGGGPITLQGRVTPKGAVRVLVTAGSQYADGSGKLTRNRGGGVWKGQGMSSACTGTWQAERRPD
jgi:hypothetical protein